MTNELTLAAIIISVVIIIALMTRRSSVEKGMDKLNSLDTPNAITPERRAYVERISREAMAKMWERERKWKKDQFDKAFEYAVMVRAAHRHTKPHYTNRGGVWREKCSRCFGTGWFTIGDGSLFDGYEVHCNHPCSKCNGKGVIGTNKPCWARADRLYLKRSW